MKPIMLEMAAWGPYKDKQIVDFKKLGNKGLFLITGHTGAGKTTIFDGICFALFGLASGADREKESFRSDFAESGEKTYVKLTFSHKSKIYEIERNPKYTRPKSRGEGNTSEEENATLRVFSEDELKIIATRSKEVSDKIKEIIGVDYSQFKQISMIAQGEFQNLLTADSKDRTKIFRDIFNTGIYEKIQKEITERVKVLFKELSDLNSRLEESVNTVSIIDNAEWDELILKKEKNYDRIRDILEFEINKDKIEDENIEKKLIDLDGLIENINIEINEIKRINEIKNEIIKYEKELKQLVEKIEEYEKKREQLTKAERYLRAKPSVDLYENSRKKLNKSLDDKKSLEEMLSSLLKRIEKNNKDLQLVDLMLQQNQQAEQMLASADSCFELINIYQKEKEDLITLGKKYLEIKKTYDDVNSRYEAAIEARKQAAIGIVAKELKDGEPCPVCGSLEHPEVASFSAELPDENTIEKLKTAVNKANIATTQAYGNAESKKAIVLRHEKEFLSEEFKLVRMELEIDNIETASQFKLNIIKIKEKNQLDIIENTKKINQVLEEQRGLEAENNSRKGQLEQITNDMSILYMEEADHKNLMEKELSKFGFTDIIDYESSEIEEKEALILKKDIEIYSEKMINLRAGLDEKKEQIKQGEEKDIDEISLKRDAYILELNKLRRLKEEVHSRVVQNEKQYISVIQKLIKNNELQEKYAVIKELENVIRGDNPRNIVFEDYVLSMYFDQILIAANLRLGKMSEGRYELHRKKDNISARSKEVLDIDVMDNYTGKRRPSTSLSGGEKFKAALALAFGTSDIVQNNVGGIEIDTLFIDEGFGSLDEESLDAAIDALLTVSKDSRLVGIISHVGELKTRINNHIEIEKINTGSRILQ